MEIRSLFKKLWGTSQSEPTNLELAKLLDGYVNSYAPFMGNAYDDSTVRDCVDTIARHFGKLRMKHVVKRDGRIVASGDSQLDTILGVRPNPFMTASEFLEKVVAQYLIFNNVFIYPKYEGSALVGLYPLDFGSVEMYENRTGYYMKFQFGGGEYITLPYEDIIHIRRYFNRGGIYGDSNESIMRTDLSLVAAVTNSIINAVRNGGALRGIIQWKATLREEDQEKALREFVRTVNESGSGFGSLDNKAEFKQLTTEVTTFDAKQMEFVQSRIYSHFGVSANIINGTYTEDQYISFYESVLEPIAIKLSQELTAKLFSDRQRAFGNEIIFESNRLSFMSVSSKIKLINTLIPSGCLTTNEVRELLGYAGVEDGDERYVSLNFIKASDISDYQVGKGGEDDDEQHDEESNDVSGDESDPTKRE